MRKLFIMLLICFCQVYGLWGFGNAVTSSDAEYAFLAGCRIFPADNIWNTPIDHLPVLSNSAAIIGNIGASNTLHPEFGAYDPDEGHIGIPVNLVSAGHPKVHVDILYADESDPGPYPIPANPFSWRVRFRSTRSPESKASTSLKCSSSWPRRTSRTSRS